MEANTVAFSVFDRNGIRVTFSLPLSDMQDVHGLIARALESGFSVNAPGLEDGEKYEEIAYLVRRAQIRDDGSEVPILDLYPEKLNYRFVSTYLDTADHVSAFEGATGLKLTDLATFEGTAKIERGKNPRHDQKYVVRLPRLTKIVFKDNPRFEEGGTKPKRYFERWHAVTPQASAPRPVQAEPVPKPPTTAAPPTASGGASPSLQVVNGEDPSVMDELFSERLERATPDALWTTCAYLFNARPHFDNWWNKHADELDKRTITDAIAFTQNERWHKDKDRVKLVFDFGVRLGLEIAETMEALTFANGKPMAKVAEWDGGNMATAHAAVLAFHVGYSIDHLNALEKEGAVPHGMRFLAEQFCNQYNEQKRESA